MVHRHILYLKFLFDYLTYPFEDHLLLICISLGPCDGFHNDKRDDGHSCQNMILFWEMPYLFGRDRVLNIVLSRYDSIAHEVSLQYN